MASEIDIRIVVAENARWNPLGSEDSLLLVPTIFRAYIDDPAFPFTVALDVLADFVPKVPPDVTRVTVQSRTSSHVGGNLLRQVRVNEYLRAAMLKASRRLADDPGWGEFVRVEEFDDAWEQGFGKDKRRTVDDDLPRRAAELYRAALEHPEHRRKPTQHVALELNVSRATAARYLQRARDQGLLGKATTGKAGEAN